MRALTTAVRRASATAPGPAAARGDRARGLRAVALVLLVGALFVPLSASAQAGGRTPQPEIVIDAEGGCVAPPDEMRRNHMNMLIHQRPLTVRQGVRGAEVSLRGCIECHASREDGSAIGTRRNFCQSCHDFVAVRLDCFDCHQARPGAEGVRR